MEFSASSSATLAMAQATQINSATGSAASNMHSPTASATTTTMVDSARHSYGQPNKRQFRPHPPLLATTQSLSSLAEAPNRVSNLHQNELMRSNRQLLLGQQSHSQPQSSAMANSFSPSSSSMCHQQNAQ